MTNIIKAHDFKCPNCQTSFSEEALMNLCAEPFNGICINCDECDKEYTLDILIRIEEVT